MNAQRAFVLLVLAAGLIGLAFLGLSFSHAFEHGDLALWGRHPLFGSGLASLIGAVLGGIFLAGFRRCASSTDNQQPQLQ